jgi:hypothetical protein
VCGIRPQHVVPAQFERSPSAHRFAVLQPDPDGRLLGRLLRPRDMASGKPVEYGKNGGGDRAA